MAILKKPTSKGNQIIVYLSGIFAGLLGLFYLFLKIDLITDAAGPVGYLDDFIALLLVVFFIRNLTLRAKGRYKENKSAYQKQFAKGNLFKLLLKPRTWVTIAALTGVIMYFFWAIDVVPDPTVGIGYLDDALVALTTMKRVFEFNNRGGK